MNIKDVEKQILYNAIEGMPSYRHPVDERKSIIDALYRYISALIPNDDFQKTIKEVMSNYVNFEHPLELTLDTIYNIHINIINRLYNRYLFEKYNIEEEYGIKVEETFYAFASNSLINFEFELMSGDEFYRDDDFYDLKITTHLKSLIPDDLNLDNISSADVLNLSEIDFPAFKRKYETFYIKYNNLVKDLELEIEILNKQCNFDLKL